MPELSSLAKISPSEFAGNVLKSWKAFLEQKSSAPTKASNVYASSYSNCTRQMTLNIVAGDRGSPWEANTLANFRRGRAREVDLLSDLSLVGKICDPPFEVVGQQERFELRDRKGRVAITGKVDGRVRIERHTNAPIEVKSWSANTVNNIDKFEDLFDNQWTISGAHQLLAYLFATEQPCGFMLLDRHGLPKLLPVELTNENLERIETFLQKAEEAMNSAELIRAAGGFKDSAEIATLLPAYIDDYEKCKRCRYFGHTCNPPTTFDGANIITDDELIEALEIAYENKPKAKEFSDAWEIVKKALHGKPISVAPGFLITGKYQKGTKYIDEAAEKAYKHAVAELDNRYTMKTDKGRFILTVSKT